MIPIRDYVPTRRLPVVTLLLIAVNAIVFLYEMLLLAIGQLDPFIAEWGVVPLRITQSLDLGAAFTLVSAMFLHGSFQHVAGNMLYLWIFGNNVEDAMGRTRFLLFYLLTGGLASLAQILADPTSAIPTIGASGAIAGILGGYLVLHPKARVSTLVFLGIFASIAELPAVFVLGSWFILQLFNGVAAFAYTQMGGVAWFAHIGGFAAGLLLVKLFVRRGYRPPTRIRL